MNFPKRFNLHTTAFADYWQFEDGKLMLDDLGYTPQIEDAKQYVPLLFECDRVADQVVEECFIGKSFPQALSQITDYATGKSTLTNAPSSVQDMLTQMHEMPDWVDKDLLDLGRKVCNRAGKSGLIVLRNYSLMLGYQSAAINKPLIATGALHSGAVKRIADTTSFWYAVTGEHALDVSQSGFVACLRTRIVHAYSRVMIKEKLDWKIDEQGEPLNFWDMVATYLGFSLVFMRGLMKLGISISEEESKAVYHLWKYIGYLIGIPAQIMPDDNNDAIRSLYLWSKTQPEADADSIALAQALHFEPLNASWPPRLHEKKFIQQVNLSFNYHLIGPRSCHILQLPDPKHGAMAKFVSKINKVDDKLGLSAEAYRKWQIKHGRAEQLIIRNRVCDTAPSK